MDKGDGNGNYDVQNVYLCGCIGVQCIKRRYSARQGESCRNFLREYHVYNGETMTQVCKKAFLSIFAVSDGRITRALKAQATAGGSPHNYHYMGGKEHNILQSKFTVQSLDYPDFIYPEPQLAGLAGDQQIP